MTEQSNEKQRSKTPNLKSFKNFSPLRLDIKCASQMHQKNLEACSRTYKATLETARRTQKQNTQYAKTLMEDIKNQIRIIRKASSQEEKFKVSTACLKDNFEKAITQP